MYELSVYYVEKVVLSLNALQNQACVESHVILYHKGRHQKVDSSKEGSSLIE